MFSLFDIAEIVFGLFLDLADKAPDNDVDARHMSDKPVSDNPDNGTDAMERELRAHGSDAPKGGVPPEPDR